MFASSRDWDLGVNHMKASACYRSICDRILDLSRMCPDATALSYGNPTLTFHQLDIKANQFAGHLLRLGVGSGSAVAICMDRSFEWIIAALGIMRLGAAYVPIDPTWPDSRVLFVLEDSGAAAFVGPAALLARLPLKVHGIDPFGHAGAIAAAPPCERISISQENLAYVIYTSGSTGTPKGVEITHGNLSHLIEWHQRAFNVTDRDRASHLAGLGFDAAVWEIWPNLSAGATLCIPDEAVRFSPELIQQWMLRERVTIGFVPTIHAAALIAMKWPATTKLRLLMTGGDKLYHSPGLGLPFSVVNNYGPTECTVVATSSLLSPGAEGVPPIGLPIADTHIYLLDEHGDQVADGEIGEIYIGGNGVGRGYRNLPGATTKSFLPDPFAGVPGARMYRTGDRGSRPRDGELEFLGRLDRQVKIRGQRVELDEISSVLNQHPDVSFAIVTSAGGEQGSTELVAYVLFKEHTRVPTTGDLQQYLLRRLPSYMIPAVVVQLDALPLTSSGKLDFAMLPDVDPARVSSRDEGTPALAQTENRLLSLLQDIFQSRAVSSTDNFFLAGGNSLLGMQLITRVQKEFGLVLTARELFETPTVKSLSSVIEKRLAEECVSVIWMELFGLKQVALDDDFFALDGDDALLCQLQQRLSAEFKQDVSRTELIDNATVRKQANLVHGKANKELGIVAPEREIQSQEARKRVFWLHYACPGLANAMGETASLVYIPLDDEGLGSRKELTLQKLGTCLLHRIVAIQPEGPYLLGGFCFGGILSYEVACQLQAAGHEVSLLVLVDTPSPEYYRAATPLKLASRPRYLSRRIRQLGLEGSLKRVWERAFNRFSTGEPKGGLTHLALEAASRYKPSVYAGKVVIITAGDHPSDASSYNGHLSWWQSFILRDLHTQYVSASHDGLMKAPAVNDVANAILSHITPVEGAVAR
jgi:amino acid adenylation domain-containing protein